MKLIKRELLPAILKWLDKPEIIVIIGSRQVGKTTLLKMIFEQIQSAQKLFFDLEDLDVLEIVNAGAKTFVHYLELQGISPDQKATIFLDEIQYAENPSNFLKILHDHYPKFKLIVSGSSTLEIRKKFTDSLTGRKVVFTLPPFSFCEFLNFKYPELFAIKQRIGMFESVLKNFDFQLSLLNEKFSFAIREYVVWGGYPRLMHENEPPVKEQILNEIYTSYVRKDIKDIAEIRDILNFNKLIKILADQISGLVNQNELSATLNIQLPTLKRYLFLLENTFIISLLNPYSTNKRKEISKMQKIFFQDVGLHNAILNALDPQSALLQKGALFENFIFGELQRRYKANESLFYWRTLYGSEVDFVLFEHNSLLPIEIKSSSLNTPKIPRSFRSFIKKYKPEKGIIFNQNLSTAIQIEGCTVFFLPFWAV